MMFSGKELMLCKDNIDKFMKAAGRKENVLWSVKLDGVRCAAVINSYTDTVSYISRNEKKFTNFIVFSEEVKRLARACGAIVLDGEATHGSGASDDFSKVMTQVHRVSDVDSSELRFHVFDFIPHKGDERQNSQVVRYARLVKAFMDESKIKPFKIVTVLEHFPMLNNDPLDLMQEIVAKGYEGIVMKIADADYTGKRSINWCKVKPSKTVDVKVIDVFSGTGKYEGMLGGVYVDYKGKQVKVGSGFTDDEREEFKPTLFASDNAIIGKIIEVKFQEETKAGSLRFPTFLRIREDKNEVEA